MTKQPKPELTLWIIYKSPADYPGLFVVRAHHVMKGKAEPVADEQVHTAETLEAARKFIPGGLHWLQRDPRDEPQIVETWI